MRQLLRRAARTLLGQRSLLPPGKRVVLVYHDISVPGAAQYSPHYSTPPDSFARHLDLLQEAFDFVPLDTLVSVGARGGAKPLAALTFDDGFRSTLLAGEPRRPPRRIPFSLFVNRLAIEDNRLEYLAKFEPPRVPRDQRVYLDAAEIRDLAGRGVHIGSHTCTHAVLARCTDAQLDAQIAGNKDYLEPLVGAPVLHLALPYGKKEHYDRRALDRAFQAGHRYVYNTNPRAFDAAELPGFSRQPIPRIGLANESNQELLFVLNRPLFRTIDI